jgi:hypothetical protein
MLCTMNMYHEHDLKAEAMLQAIVRAAALQQGATK